VSPVVFAVVEVPFENAAFTVVVVPLVVVAVVQLAPAGRVRSANWL
jgi:hypothetical protein